MDSFFLEILLILIANLPVHGHVVQLVRPTPNKSHGVQCCVCVHCTHVLLSHAVLTVTTQRYIYY